MPKIKGFFNSFTFINYLYYNQSWKTGTVPIDGTTAKRKKILRLEYPATFSVKNSSQFVEVQLRKVDHCAKII